MLNVELHKVILTGSNIFFCGSSCTIGLLVIRAMNALDHL